MNKQELIKKFEPNDINFKVDKFEELILQDMTRFDEDTRVKLHRNLTKLFNKWLEEKLQAKELVKINIKGQTRSNLGNTKVLMANFENKRLDLIKVGDEVLSWNKNNKKIEKKEVQEIFLNGTKPVFELILEGGKKITSSYLHKFYRTKQLKRIVNKIGDNKYKSYWSYIKPEWEEVQNLNIGDFIAVPKKIDIEKSCNIELNELKLLGLWLADGYFFSDERCAFDFSRENKIEYILNLEKNTKQDYKLRINNNGQDYKNNPNWKIGHKYFLTKKIQYRTIKKKDYFSQLVIDLKLNKCVCDDKFIPNKIKLGTKQEIINLLSGLFTGDSSVDINKGLIFTSTSKKLIDDTKICLTKLGIIYNESIKKKQNENHKTAYNISIQYKKDLIFILKYFHLDKDKQERLNKLINSKTRSVKNYADFGGDLIFRKIKKIEYKGEKKVYDIEIKDNHNYIANLILSHNSGKSLIGLKILNTLTEFYPEKTFNTENQVCGNQKEYRQRVSTAEFGDSFLVDENAFANVGAGSMTEVQQLKDVLNITAKQNLHSIFITPRTFLDTGATMGLSYFGKDTNNWLSRFLLYSLKNNMPTLLGFVIFDVGKLFQDTGCYIYKYTGGCTNPKRLLLKDIKNIFDNDLIKYSNCIPKDKKGKILNKDKIIDTKQQCPFYNICTSQMCNYEHKKDKWIEKELTGGLDDRDLDRYTTAVKLFEEFSNYDDTSQSFRLSAKNGKELRLKLKMKIPKLTSTKYTGVELDEIMTLVTSMTSIEFMQDVCSQIGLDYEEILNNIINKSKLELKTSDKNKQIK